jgi:hypothetical protein
MTMLIVAFRNFAEAPNNFLPLETTCLLPSSAGGHATGVVYTFLALTRNVSVSKRFFVRGLLHRHESNVTVSVGCESTFYWNSILSLGRM